LYRERLVVAPLGLPLLDRFGVTRREPSCMRAMSSGVLTMKNSAKVSRFTPIRIGIAYNARRTMYASI
jgi:hypothetical protein